MALWSALLPKTEPARLRVGNVRDPVEREADRLADHAMRASEFAISKTTIAQKTPLLATDAGKLHTARLRKGRASENSVAKAPSSISNVIQASGNPLDRGTRAFFEPRFGYDFSHVRVHTNGTAATSARALNAKAYTIGSDIVFGAGEYTPATIAGRMLLAHELAHVVQNSATSAGEPVHTIRRQVCTEAPPLWDDTNLNHTVIELWYKLYFAPLLAEFRLSPGEYPYRADLVDPVTHEMWDIASRSDSIPSKQAQVTGYCTRATQLCGGLRWHFGTRLPFQQIPDPSRPGWERSQPIFEVSPVAEGVLQYDYYRRRRAEALQIYWLGARLQATLDEPALQAVRASRYQGYPVPGRGAEESGVRGDATEGSVPTGPGAFYLNADERVLANTLEYAARRALYAAALAAVLVGGAEVMLVLVPLLEAAAEVFTLVRVVAILRALAAMGGPALAQFAGELGTMPRQLALNRLTSIR